MPTYEQAQFAYMLTLGQYSLAREDYEQACNDYGPNSPIAHSRLTRLGEARVSKERARVTYEQSKG